MNLSNLKSTSAGMAVAKVSFFIIESTVVPFERVCPEFEALLFESVQLTNVMVKTSNSNCSGFMK
jgi:hypothetical protein